MANRIYTTDAEDAEDNTEAAEYARMNRDLRRQRAVLQHIIDTVPHSIFWKDRNSVYLGANKTKLRALGLASPDQLVGKTDYDTRVSKQQADHYRTRDRDVMAKGEPLLNLEETQSHPDGEKVLLTSKVPLRDDENDVIGIAGICIDITERKRMEVELQRAKAVAESAASARRDFLCAMGHEIRTPLTLILGPLDAILSGEVGALPKQVMADLSRVRRNAGRLFTLANDILDFTKLETGKMQLFWETVDPPAVVSAILDDALWIADQKRLQVRFAPDPGLEAILLDRSKFEKIAMNLITNAFKFTPPDGRIEVALRRQADDLELVVADTGPGIPADKQELIFQRFQQVDPSPAQSQQGAGFGLALVRELTELLGGTVRVESQLGAGSRFVVRIPIRRDVAGATPLAWVPGDSAAPAIFKASLPVSVDAVPDGGDRRSPEGLASDRPLVLIVEDSEDMRGYMRDILCHHYDVDVAGDGRQALEMVRQRKPCVVVADVMMPQMDGHQLVSALKADPAFAELPVILVTARASREDVVAGLDVGADDYLTKPFSPAELRARVRAAERQYRTYQQLAAKHRELAAALDKLHETQAELVRAEKMAALGTLVAGMSHELGNPVTAILMNAQRLLGAAPQEPAGRLSLEVIERQARRVGRLIKLLLDASLSKQVATIPVAVDALVARVAELGAIAQLRCDGVALKLEPVDPGLPTVNASVEEMEVALLHLIKNGLEAAMPNGQVTVRVRGREEQGTPGVEIAVADSGSGIPPHLLPQIFDPLFTTKPVGTGLGLGLALARRIVESHRGQIRVDSQLGVGTRMRIWLPAADAAH